MTDVFTALALLADPGIILAMTLASVAGLAVGALPGLTATMGVALMIPITFYMPPLQALAAVMSFASMAIFAGDIPGVLLRIPGTPASAAYADESHKMVLRGQGGLALGICLICSAIGGVFGAIVLIAAAPSLALLALQFSSYEKFWLVCLGLTAAVAVSSGHWLKGALSLMLGLLIAQVGLDPVAGQNRFTFGWDVLRGGLPFIPILIGFFAVSELLRYAHDAAEPVPPPIQPINTVLRGVGKEIRVQKWGIFQGNVVGLIIGVIPGAGADIAAYVSYALSRRFSRRPHEFGTGIPDGLAAATTANNSAVGGALIPTTVFGIPGDSLTAVILGILFLKGLNPGPTVFLENPTLITAVLLSFLLANILMVPFGLLGIAAFQPLMRLKRSLLMPIVFLFCVVGAFAVENTLFSIGIIVVFGVIAYILEHCKVPLAPAILGFVVGPMLEESFLSSLVRARGNLIHFVERPPSIVLATITITIWLLPLVLLVRRLVRKT